MQANEIVRNERGADVCHRVVQIAVEKVKGDASKGYKYVDAYCNKPVVHSISEGMKICPSCDKQPPIGNVHPRITNAAGIKLTPAELKECGVTDDSFPATAPVDAVEAIPAVEAKVEIKKDEVVLSIPLHELEGSVDVATLLIKKVIESFGTLPVTNFAESKRLIRLEEKLEAIVRA